MLTRAVLAAFPIVEGAIPCIATVPAGPVEAGCGIVDIFAPARIVSGRSESAAFEEVEVEGCGASAGITLEGAVLEETEVVEVFLVGASIVLEGILEVEVVTFGVVVEWPLAAEVGEGRFTATIVEKVRKMFGE